jgi:hypothetical protein
MLSFVGLLLAIALLLVVASWVFPPADKCASAAVFVLIVAVAMISFGKT